MVAHPAGMKVTGMSAHIQMRWALGVLLLSVAAAAAATPAAFAIPALPRRALKGAAGCPCGRIGPGMCNPFCADKPSESHLMPIETPATTPSTINIEAVIVSGDRQVRLRNDCNAGSIWTAIRCDLPPGAACTALFAHTQNLRRRLACLLQLIVERKEHHASCTCMCASMHTNICAQVQTEW